MEIAERVPECLRENVFVVKLDELLRWAHANSIWPLSSGLACCAIEMMTTATARFDLARFGYEVFRPCPRQADLFIVAGTLTWKMAPAVVRLYEEMPEPKYVIAMGACAIAGGPFADSYSVVSGVDELLPVDVYIPGCPPRPEMLLNAMLELTRQIEKKPLFKHREEIARAVEAAALSATPTHEMKGLLA